MSKKSLSELTKEQDETETIEDQDLPQEQVQIPIAQPKQQTEVPPIGPVVTAKGSSEKTVLRDYRALKHKRDEKLMASIGLSRKFCPPITRKLTAVYQLYNFKGKVDRRLDGKDTFIDPFPYQLAPTYTFTDTEDPDLMRREKTLSYFDGTETVNIEDPVTKQLRPQSVPKLGAPEIIGGQAMVNIMNSYQRYVWWELHPRNASNKWRDFSKEPIFERVDIRFGTPHINNIREDIKLEAQNYLASLKNRTDQLINLAAGLTNPTVNTFVDPQQLYLTLRMRAQNNPEEILFTAHNKVQGSVKVALIHALDYSVIAWVGDQGCYYFGDAEFPMYRVPIDNDPFESLCKFMTTDEGKEYYDMIVEQLGFWY